MSGLTGAVVLAAGKSRRMGKPKMLLPWGKTTVIGQVIHTLYQAERDLQVVVVAGEWIGAIQAAAASDYSPLVIFNPDFEKGEMLSSLKLGLAQLPARVDAALVALGDQPQIEVEVVMRVVRAYRENGARLVVPSYRMRRGHPWLVERSLWPHIFDLSGEQTLRDLLARFSSEIHYVDVDTPSVLKDLDTPEDYQSEKPAE